MQNCGVAYGDYFMLFAEQIQQFSIFHFTLSIHKEYAGVEIHTGMHGVWKLHAFLGAADLLRFGDGVVGLVAC